MIIYFLKFIERFNYNKFSDPIALLCIYYFCIQYHKCGKKDKPYS